MGVTNERAFDSLAWRFHKWGVRPDHLSFLQAPVYLAMIAVALQAHEDLRVLFWFGCLQILVIVIDGADGILARRTGTATRRGHLIDSLFDIIGIGITIWAVSILYPTVAQWALALLFVNFLVYLQNEIQGTKAVTYTRGPATIGLYLQQFYPSETLAGQPALVFAGLLLPLAFGGALMLTRLDWRKRLWNYYQFLTAGQRREYVATPREERARLRVPPGPPAGAAPPTGAPAEPDRQEHAPKGSGPR